MKGETRRTFAFGMPSVLATSPTPQAIIWFDVQIVSLSPCHCAMEACGSIIACDSSGVVYVASSRTGAAANAPGKSPVFVSGGPAKGEGSGSFAAAISAARSKRPGERV
ncbi:hypothetical protein D9M72_438880 [compost metagenome]